MLNINIHVAHGLGHAHGLVLDPTGIRVGHEPVAGLDAISLGVIAQLIRDLNDALGATSVIVTHDVAEALEMVARCRAEGLDAVLGSRFLGATVNMPFSRRLVIKAAVVFTRLTTGLNLTDAHNGLRVLSRDAARKIRIRQDRMAHASEILSQIARLRLNWREHPVTITYSEYSLAKGQKISNSVRILEDMLFGARS